jgi:hypothetical protein
MTVELWGKDYISQFSCLPLIPAPTMTGQHGTPHLALAIVDHASRAEWLHWTGGRDGPVVSRPLISGQRFTLLKAVTAMVYVSNTSI